MQHRNIWKHRLETKLQVQRVIIFDGMALVNSVSKTDNMMTCRDFAESFLEKLINFVANYDEVRLVLDRYLNTSLKEQMRKKRTVGNQRTTTSMTAR